MKYQIAHRLADYYGHTWARAISPSVLSEIIRLNEGIDDAILGAIETASDDWLWEHDRNAVTRGIVCPEVDDEDGAIVHRTGTGRLGWRTFPWGEVELSVYRPGFRRAAMILDISADGTIRVEARAEIAARHWHAVADFLAALNGEEDRVGADAAEEVLAAL